MKRLALLILVLGLLIIEPYLGSLRVQSKMEDARTPSSTEFFFRFLGEIRYTLAAYLWLKTEVYHHELGLNFTSSQIGREDPKKVGEILAICRLVTRLDPEFVQAYDLGAWRLARGLGKTDEAIRFLKEGVALNPKNPVLYDDLGEIYFFFLKDCDHSIAYLEKAAQLNRNKTPLGFDLRILGRCYESKHDISKALAAYQWLLQIFPEDAFARARISKIKAP